MNNASISASIRDEWRSITCRRRWDFYFPHWYATSRFSHHSRGSNIISAKGARDTILDKIPLSLVSSTHAGIPFSSGENTAQECLLTLSFHMLLIFSLLIYTPKLSPADDFLDAADFRYGVSLMPRFSNTALFSEYFFIGQFACLSASLRRWIDAIAISLLSFSSGWVTAFITPAMIDSFSAFITHTLQI